jgi:hypothetical protein
LLKQANAEDVKAAAEKEHTEKLAANAPWIADAAGVLYFLEKDAAIPQATVNEVRAMRENLANGTAGKDDWFKLVATVEETRKTVKANKLAVKNAEIECIEAEKTAIRNDDPPAGSAAL